MRNLSNISNEEWTRLNDISEPRILDLLDIEHQYDCLVDSLNEYTPVNWVERLEHIYELESEEDLLKYIEQLIELAEQDKKEFNNLLDMG